MDGIDRFNSAIRTNIVENTSFLKGRMRYIASFSGIAAKLKRQEKLRKLILASEGLIVPPILIISVTNDCNLACRGCYACAQNRVRKNEMTIEEIDRIVGEAIAAGVGIVFLAGGEPLLKAGLLGVAEKFKDTLFVLFTNGVLIDVSTMNHLKKTKNIVPAISLEGGEASTDARRGGGVYTTIRRVMQDMDRKRLLFGASITLTCENYDEVMHPKFLKELESSGCRAIFLIEYVPCEGDPELCLSEKQKEDLLRRMQQLSKEFSMLLVTLPGDEKKYNGCLAAGRGFLHVSSSGNVEACPFAPFSDLNLTEISFLEALESRLMGKIRENHHLLKEAEGGCTLFENQKWVAEIADKRETTC